MKTYYDITLVTQRGDKVDIKGLTHKQMYQLTTNDSLRTIIVNKEYTKKISKY